MISWCERYVIRHIPYQHGYANILTSTAPTGRYGMGKPRYRIQNLVTYVVLWHDDPSKNSLRLSCLAKTYGYAEATFFDKGAVLPFIELMLGNMDFDCKPIPYPCNLRSDMSVEKYSALVLAHLKKLNFLP